MLKSEDILEQASRMQQVREFLDGMLNKDLIPQKQLARMKNDARAPCDPNLIMDLRHYSIEVARRRRSLSKLENNSDGNEKASRKSKTGITTNRTVKENNLIQQEIKRMQKQFDCNNRKTIRMIVDTRRSSRETAGKLTNQNGNKSREKRDNDPVPRDLGGTAVWVMDSPRDNRSESIEKQMSSLREINEFLRSLDDLQPQLTVSEYVVDSGVYREEANCGDHDQTDRQPGELGVNETNYIEEENHLINSDQVEYEESDRKESIEGHGNVETELCGTLDLYLEKPMKHDNSDCGNEKYKLEAVKSNEHAEEMRSDCAEHATALQQAQQDTIEKMQQLIHEINKSTFRNQTKIISGETTCQQSPVSAVDGGDTDTSCKTEVTANDKYLMNKFWIKWKRRVKCWRIKDSKEEAVVRSLVDRKFDKFLSELHKRIKERREVDGKGKSGQKESGELESSIGVKMDAPRRGNFQHRLTAQKYIIERQKQILKDQREKIKILEGAELPKAVTPKADSSNKTKSARNEKIISNKKHNEKRENLHLLKEPKFVVNMNRRATERKEKWKQLEEIKLKKEEEKLQIRIKQDLEKKRRQEEEKMREEQAEYLKQMLKREERRREMEDAREVEMRVSAMLMYRYLCIWKQAVVHTKQYSAAVNSIHKNNLKRRCFHVLRLHVQRSRAERAELALHFRTTRLQKKYCNIWYQTWKEVKEMEQVAADYNDMRLKLRAIVCLWWNKEQANRQTRMLLVQADRYHSRKLLSKTFNILRNFPKQQYEERESEKRIRAWESRVREIIPDFCIP